MCIAAVAVSASLLLLISASKLSRDDHNHINIDVLLLVYVDVSIFLCVSLLIWLLLLLLLLDSIVKVSSEPLFSWSSRHVVAVIVVVEAIVFLVFLSRSGTARAQVIFQAYSRHRLIDARP